MKTYYTLISRFMNGTVTMHTDVVSFTSKELAEKTKESIIENNKDAMFPVLCNIEETKVYESENEVPILNKNK